MKGALGCMFYALKALKACGIRLRGDVVFQSVAGEESQQAEEIGTCRVLGSGYRTDFAICGEPTGNEIHISSSAIFFARIVVIGKSVHISARNQALFPQPANLPSGDGVGVDAFRKSLPIVDYMTRLETEWNHRFRDRVLGYGGRPGHDAQGVGVFTINPSFISGGEYLGTLPARMEYTYAIWYPDRLVTKEALIEEIRAGIAAIASTDGWLREHPPLVEAPVVQDWVGFYLPEEHEGVKCLERACRMVTGEAVLSGFKAVCDATYMNQLGVPAVICGPGELSNSVHGDEEFVALDKLVQAAKIYALFAMDWCGLDEREGGS